MLPLWRDVSLSQLAKLTINKINLYHSVHSTTNPLIDFIF